MKDSINEWLDSGTIFNIENKLILGFGKRQWIEEPDKFQTSFYFPDFFLKFPTPWFTQECTVELNVSELLSILPHIDNITPKNYLWDTPHKQLFIEVFHDLQTKIAAGELDKGVPYIIESVKTSMSKEQLIKSLKSVLKYVLNNPAKIYGFWDKNEGMIGATPEVLFRYGKDGLLETMACAGTKNILEDQNIFLSDSKELFEHELVVKGIAESLRLYGKVVVEERQLLKLSKLMHLMTPLTVQLDRTTPFQEIVQTLHPTPALGAFPKNEGNIWLQNLQKSIDRVRYGAPVGFLIPEKIRSHCYVAIRNVQWNSQEMLIAAGCGVISDSNCEKEWAEIQLKLTAIKEMLAL